MAKRNTEARWIESSERWQINVQCKGVRKTFVSSKPGRKGKLEAERKADDWLARGLSDEHSKVTLLLDMYLEDIKLRNGERSTSYTQAEKFVRLYIKPVIGAKRMEDLSAGDCQRVIDTSFRAKNLSRKTLQGVRSTIMAFLKWARMNKKSALFVEGLTIPAGAKTSTRTILQPEALTALFTVDTTLYHRAPRVEPLIWAFRFAVLTGLRPGELLGLQWGDISNGQYTIRRAINERGDVTSGKNDNARRTGAIGELAQYVLDQQRIAQAHRGISKWVFGFCGEFTPQHRYYSHWKQYCASNGITEGTKPYELRHTFVSVNDEMPDGLKKMVMGHSKSMDTEGVYGHEKRDDRLRAAAYIDEAFAKYAKTCT